MGRTVWAWVRMLGGLAILGLLGWRLGTSAFVSGLHVIDGGTLLAACGIGLLTTVFSAWRWRLVARGLGIHLPLRTAVADYYRALFLNAALPGGILGDVHRAVRHGQDAGDVGRGVRAVVLERTAGMVVFVVAGLGLLLALPSSLPPLTRLLPAPMHTGVVALVIVGAVAGLLAWSRPWRGASRWARGLRTSLVDVRRGLFSPTTGPGVVLASAIVLAGHLATFLVAARAAGSTAPLTTLAPLMVLALLAMVLPLSVGGWGPREGVTAWAFGAAGLSPSLGLTIAVVYGVLAFAASLPGAAVLLYRWRAAARTRAASRLVAAQASAAAPASAAASVSAAAAD
ncbi:flippase-like domain-containing protein, partial [Micromonospora sp. CPCC 205371]|nr:flippase-like domain-containing protein [Micromonospora sp. CPCC 205371]